MPIVSIRERTILTPNVRSIYTVASMAFPAVQQPAAPVVVITLGGPAVNVEYY